MSIFAKRDGIIGECSDGDHPGWMDVLRIKWDISRKITSATGTSGDRESSNAIIGDLVIIRRMDKATPKIFMESCCGSGKDFEIQLNRTRKQLRCIHVLYSTKCHYQWLSYQSPQR